MTDNVRDLVAQVVREVMERRQRPSCIALGADHGGFPLKEHLKGYLSTLGYMVKDCGTLTKDACDYPDIAKAVSRAVQDKSCSCGIMIDGAGIGSSMVCNKFRGIRAALCYDMKSVLNSRQHNNANVLTLGAFANPVPVVEEMVKTWIATPFEGGRHLGRVAKIEQEY